jgi:cytochrome c biogenesis protein CcdA
MFDQGGRFGNSAGFTLGFLLSYSIFTTILFYVLTFTEKIPTHWNWFHIGGITAGIILMGLWLRKVL